MIHFLKKNLFLYYIKILKRKWLYNYFKCELITRMNPTQKKKQCKIFTKEKIKKKIAVEKSVLFLSRKSSSSGRSGKFGKTELSRKRRCKWVDGLGNDENKLSGKIK